MLTTPGGWPYLEDSDHPLQYPAASQALANKLDAQGVVRKVFTKTADTAGQLTITAAEMGLAAFTGAVANIWYSPSANNPIFCNVRVTNATTLNIIAFKAVNAAANPIAFYAAASASITVYVIAW